MIRLRPARRLLVLAVLVPVAASGDYQAGLDAYQAGDYETALAEWKAEISQPAPPANLAIYREALYGIAMLYWKGEGVEQNYSTSAVWLKQAADINHPGAQVKLGYLYSTGQGVPQNFREARRWLELAAVQGDPDAAHNLAVLDREGLGRPDALDAAGPHPVTAPVAEEVTDSNPAAVMATGTEPGEAPPMDSAATDAATDAGPAAEGDMSAAWILAQDPDHYTIQVIALRDPSALLDFVARHADWSPFAIYTPAGNALPLWVLVQGDYPDVGSARVAAEQFPTGLQRREELLIRRFRGVQGMIE